MSASASASSLGPRRLNIAVDEEDGDFLKCVACGCLSSKILNSSCGHQFCFKCILLLNGVNCPPCLKDPNAPSKSLVGKYYAFDSVQLGEETESAFSKGQTAVLMKSVEESVKGSSLVSSGDRDDLLKESNDKIVHNACVMLFEEVAEVSQGVDGLDSKIRKLVEVKKAKDAEAPCDASAVSSLCEELPTSYDGTQVWIIPGLLQKLQEARSHPQRALRSPEFYTAKWGYKLQVKLYLNGDFANEGEFISLFLIVKENRHDGWISWPLDAIVTVTLMTQSGQPEHMRRSFRTTFQRPEMENVSSEFAQFLALDDFNRDFDRFIQEDQMILEIKVDDQREREVMPWRGNYSEQETPVQELKVS